MPAGDILWDWTGLLDIPLKIPLEGAAFTFTFALVIVIYARMGVICGLWILPLQVVNCLLDKSFYSVRIAAGVSKILTSRGMCSLPLKNAESFPPS